MAEAWRKCSSCKKDLLTGGAYYVCSISTCRSNITNYAFCSISCWDAHLPVERHREGNAGAIEKKAPNSLAEAQATPGGVKRIVSAATSSSAKNEEDVLVVVTKVRKYIADRSGMNTSAGVYDILTERIKLMCDRAIETARADSRKTVMDRDIP